MKKIFSCILLALTICHASEKVEVPNHTVLKELNLEQDKLLLLDFWAFWCRNCALSIPQINDLHREFEKSGLQVVGVGMDEKINRKVRAFLKKFPMDYPIYFDFDKRISTQFNISVLPAFVLLGKNGKVIFEAKGYEKDHFEELKQVIIENL